MLSDKTTFPTALQAALLLLAGFLLQVLLGAALHDLRHLLGITNEQMQALVMLLSNGTLITAVIHIRRTSHRALMHPSRSSPVLTFFFLVPPVLLLIPFTVLLDALLNEVLQAVLPLSTWEQRVFAEMGAASLPSFVMVCLIAPVVEEMLFRGILLRSFLEQYPRALAIGYSALFFGAAHLNIYQFAVAFFMGLLLGWLYERSHSLIPCIALHAAVNGTVTVMGWSQTPDANLNSSEVSAFTWLAAAIAAAVGMIALHRLLRRNDNAVANAV